MLDFVYQKNSPLPADTQIKEQIKVALLLGTLRPGDMLPSIRDLERDLKISRNTVRKAYVDLEKLGILRLIQGKGVMVNRDWKYKEDHELLTSCEDLARKTLRACQSIGVIPSSFAKYMQHRAIEYEQEHPPLAYVDVNPELAQERAEQISETLHLNVLGISIEELRDRVPGFLSGTKIMCNYYRYDDVRKMLRKSDLKVIPMRMRIADTTQKELQQLPEHSKVVFVFDGRDKAGLGLILEDYRKTFSDRGLDFAAHASDDLEALMRSNAISKVLVSNRIWSALPSELRDSPKVTHPSMEFDPADVEELKIELGIIG